MLQCAESVVTLSPLCLHPHTSMAATSQTVFGVLCVVRISKALCNPPLRALELDALEWPLCWPRCTQLPCIYICLGCQVTSYKLVRLGNILS